MDADEHRSQTHRDSLARSVGHYRVEKESTAADDCRPLVGSAMTEIDKLKPDIVFTVRLRGQELVFHSTWGLFSPRAIDDGSYLLIQQVDVRPAYHSASPARWHAAMDSPTGDNRLRL